MALPPLKVRIGADVSDLQGGLQKAGRAVRGFSIAAVAGLATVTAGLAAMTSQGLAAVDAQAKLARSVGGTVNGLQNLSRAADLAGISQGQLNATLQRMTRRISLAEQETGPAADALERLGLSAENLNKIDVDQRLDKIVRRVKEFVPAAQQAGVFSQIFGEEAGIMIGRLDSDTIRQATEDITNFGVAVSQEAAANIERANDAITRMGLVFQGLSNRLAADLAPVLENVANRFNEFASSDAARAAVQRLVEAFGNLAEILTGGDFLTAAIGGLETVANVAAGAAEAMVTLSQNVEVAAIAAGGLASVLIAVGGPLSLIVGLLGGAAAGLYTWSQRAQDASRAGTGAKDAADALNTALAHFSDTASPAAARQARDLAQANIDIKRTALEAARAELAKAEAIATSDARVGNPGSGPDAVDVIIERRQAQVAELEAAISDLEGTSDRLSQAMGVGGVRPRMRPIDGGSEGPEDPEDPEDPETTDIPGLGSAGAVQGQMQGRLDALLTGLQTERETINEWREESMEALKEARENELITEEDFRERKEQIEQKHQDRMDQLQQRERRARMQTLSGLFGDLSSLMRTENEKLFKIGQAAAIANATVSGYQAAVEAWNKGMSVGGPPVAAAFTAASLAKTGVLISQIASASPSGSGGGQRGGGGGGGGDGGAAASAPQIDTQRVDINIVGGNDRDRVVAKEVISALNNAQRDGFRLDPRLIGA